MSKFQSGFVKAFFLATVLLVGPERTAAAELTLHGNFQITGNDQRPIITSSNLRCLSLEKAGDGKTFLSLSLTEHGENELMEHTKRNKGKKLRIDICGKMVSNSVIKSTVGNGIISTGPLDEFQVSCLKERFVLAEKCTACPLCK